jgi:hypothetical protein
LVERASRPLCTMLDLTPEELETGAWHDDFLALGHRLRTTYGNQLTLNERAPAYEISLPRDVVVIASCPVVEECAGTVRIAAPVRPVSGEMSALFEFAVRENAELQLARLSFSDETLWVEYQLPFCAAHAPALQAAVTAVGATAARLRRELANAYLAG